LKRSYGFTLIELLIVVAIIAILAAIAVPNFLEAQTRAKVSRVKADLRSMGTAIETYTIDHNKQPMDYNVNGCGDPALPLPPGMPQPSGILHPGARLSNGTIRIGLTTPVSYISNCWIEDPFIGRSGGNIDFDQQVYTYNPFWTGKLWGRDFPTGTYNTNKYQAYYGTYRLGSIGPDRNFYNETGATSGLSKASRVYDPTNGTLSWGNIWRSQKETEVTGRPPLDPL